MPILDKTLSRLCAVVPPVLVVVAAVAACAMLTGCGGGGSDVADTITHAELAAELPAGTPGGRDGCATTSSGSGADRITISQCWTNATRMSCTSAKGAGGVLFAPAICTHVPG